MTNGPERRRLSRSKVASAVACLLLLVGCSLRQEPATQPRGSSKDPVLARELKALDATQNGLYGHPHLWTPTPGLAETVYGAAILRAASGDMTLRDSPALAEAAREATQTAPLTGRWLRMELGRALGKRMLGAFDYGQIRALVRPTGWFDNPEVPAPTDPTARLVLRLETTALSLEILASSQAGLPPAMRLKVRTWLDAAAGDARVLREPCASFYLSRAMGALGSAPPGSVNETASSWARALRKGDRFSGPEAFQRAWCGVLLADRVGADLSSIRVRLVDAIKPLAFSDVPLRTWWQATMMLTILETGRSALQAVADRVADRQLPDGSFRAEQVRFGTLANSYYVQAIRRVAGISPVDRPLATAVDEVLASDEGKSASPLSRAYAAFAGEWSKGREPDRATRVVQLLHESAPDDLIAESVLGWHPAANMLRAFRAPLPERELDPWPINDREGLYKAAVAVRIAGRDAGAELGLTPSMLTREFHRRPRLSLPELGEYIGALRVLGRGLAPTDLAAVKTRLSELRGCQRFKSLYRATTADPNCDLRSTLAALEILDEDGN